MKKFFSFLISKALITNVVLAIIVTFVLIWVGLNYLDNYTRHGEKKPVPNVIGMRIDLAQAEIEGQKLQWVITDSVYSEAYPPMAVVDQHPRPDSNFVKTNRKIYLTVNSLEVPQVMIPDVVGKSLRNARTILNIKGFTLGELMEVEDEDEMLRVGDTVVMEQFYKGRMIDSVEVDKGSVIKLKVKVPAPQDEEEDGEGGEEPGN